jgi:hypothetical protein
MEDINAWTIEPLIVTALPLVSSFLARPKVRIVSYSRLKGMATDEPLHRGESASTSVDD